jgi:DNA replication protein DnaC
MTTDVIGPDLMTTLRRLKLGKLLDTLPLCPDEWLATFADPIRAQAAVDRFTSNAYDLVIDGESYRARLKPSMKNGSKAGQKDSK